MSDGWNTGATSWNGSQPPQPPNDLGYGPSAGPNEPPGQPGFPPPGGGFAPPGGGFPPPPGSGPIPNGFAPPNGAQQGSSSGTLRVVLIIGAIILGMIILAVIGFVALVNRMADAEPLTNGELLNERGSVTATSAETFTFDVPVRSTVQIDVVADSSLDPMAELYLDDQMIASDDDSGSFTDAQMTLSLEPGVYTLRVVSYGTETGGFRAVVGYP